MQRDLSGENGSTVHTVSCTHRAFLQQRLLTSKDHSWKMLIACLQAQRSFWMEPELSGSGDKFTYQKKRVFGQLHRKCPHSATLTGAKLQACTTNLQTLDPGKKKLGKQAEEMPFGGGLFEIHSATCYSSEVSLWKSENHLSCKGGQKSTTPYRRELEISQQEAHSEFGKKGH